MNSRVAQRYAETFFLSARKNSRLDALQKEVALLHSLFDASPQLSTLWKNRMIVPEQLAQALFRALPTLSPDGERFVRFLAKRRRLALLPEILRELLLWIERDNGIARAKVRSASPLESQQQLRIEAILEKRYGTRHQIDYSIDPELIGGFVIEREGEVIDSSLQHQLYTLRQKFSA